MKPSSIDEPTARYKAGSATAMAEATTANEAQVRRDVLRKIFEMWTSPPWTKELVSAGGDDSACESDIANFVRILDSNGKMPTAAKTHNAGSAGTRKRVVPYAYIAVMVTLMNSAPSGNNPALRLRIKNAPYNAAAARP